MALADSVPGVSGGTVAFLLGFYDKFIGSIHNLFFGSRDERKEALTFLLRLGCGWIVGMILAILVLSSLFASQIYVVSSVFLGFIIGGIPVIVMEEKDGFRHVMPGVFFALLGAAIVVAVAWMSSVGGVGALTLVPVTWTMLLRLVITGAFTIGAMFLPGISGSTILLIFGAYMPVISGVRRVFGLDFSALPAILALVVGVIAGALCIVKLIKTSLEKYRPQMMYLVLGMMVGSLYAIWMGPTTLDVPQPAMSPGSFSILGCLGGFALVALLQLAKTLEDRRLKQLEDQAKSMSKTRRRSGK